MVAPSPFVAEPMPSPVVIGLVLTLATGTPAEAAALAALRTRAEIELGARQDHWLPLVAATPFPRELHRWVESLPGVEHVDVAFVELPEISAAASDGPLPLFPS